MERGSWSDFSGDSEIWKKIAIGATSALLLVPIPLALGAVTADLEAELERIKAQSPPGKFIAMNDLLGLLGKGVIPSCILFLVLLAFAAPSVVVGLSLFQNYGWLRDEGGVSIFSFLLSNLFALLAIGVQFFITITFPIALAQYARGMNLKPAVDPLANFGFAMEMGAKYWFKAAGFWLMLCANVVFFVVGLRFVYYLPLAFVTSFLGFASLVVASRYALGQLQTKL